VPLLKVRQISKAYGAKTVISGLSFEVQRGECLFVVGGSGIGKSVLLRLLTGLETCDSGSLLFDGQELAHADERLWLTVRQRMGVVFQQAALLDSLEIFENVGLRLLHERKTARKDVEAKVENALRQVGLESSVLKLYPAQLSGGMRKRAGIARALVHEPDLLLYDEPTAGLDPVNAHRIDLLIKELHLAGRTTIVVSHDLDSVRLLADRVLWLRGSDGFAWSDSRAFFASDCELFIREKAQRDFRA